MIKNSCFRILLLLTVIFFGGESCKSDQKMFVASNPLSRIVKYSFTDNGIDYLLNNLVLAAMQQTGVLMTVEAELPPVSEHLIGLSAHGEMPIGKWLEIFKSKDPSLSWIVDGDVIHILLSNGHKFSNPLDTAINFSFSGNKTLEEWQQLVQQEYPNYNFVFDGNGLRMQSDDPSNFEYHTRKFYCSAHRGMTLRQYYTKVVSCYGNTVWIIEFTDPKIIDASDVVPPQKVTWVSFRTIHRHI